jgi:signal transduction histidine kinase/DNA-binding response OmpR family regulator/HAMP domain-containing protein
MKINDLKTGTQLKFGFGIILFLIILLAIVSWRQTDKIALQASELYEHPFTVRYALGALQTEIQSMHKGMKDLFLAENETEFEVVLHDIEKDKSDAFLHFDIISERFLGEKILVDDAYNEFLKWNTIREETIRLYHSGQINEALARTKKTGIGGNQAEILLNSISAIDQKAKDFGEKFHNESIYLKKFLNRQLLFFTLFILAFAFILVIVITNNINRPLHELSKATGLFREGNRNVRSNFISKNEFGKLSLSFNDMADSIEAELTLKERSVKLSEIMLKEEDAHQFCNQLLVNLMEQTEAQMGALYLLTDDKTTFEKFECIGMNAEACKPFSASHYEGEFGIAITTGKLQHIKSIPNNSRFTFVTVSGDFKPSEIITMPILSDNKTVAIISLVTIKSFSNSNVLLLQSIFNTLSARLVGVFTYQQVVNMTHLLQNQNQLLEAQKTELSAQTRELTEQNTELELQKNQLNEANRLKTVFLSNMSHELRTPLNSVIALSGVLNRKLEGKIPKDEYSYIEVIERNGKLLLSLINDILDLSRIEAGHEEIEIDSFNINNLISEVTGMIRPQAEQKNIGLNHVGSNEKVFVATDAVKCRHILQNLIGNAVKFTEKGHVEVEAKSVQNGIAISVTDTGIGIEPGHIAHIFDEFRQADGSTSRRFGGTGLGLAIARKYAQLLNGSINVKSKPGSGSTFTLVLPVAYSFEIDKNETPLQASVSTSVKQGIITHTAGDFSKTILLIEDSEPAIIQMEYILQENGYNVIVAKDGLQALDLLNSGQPDGIILDLMMPGIDGFEVLRKLRESSQTSVIPVLILTAKHVTKAELEFLKGNNVFQLIQKGDVNLIELLSTVARMVYPVPLKTEKTEKRLPQFKGKPRLLIVEDNTDNMFTVKALLDGDFYVLEAVNGRLAVDMATKHIPHLILMDIALPEMDGIEAFNAIRNDERLKHIPVIALTASAMSKDREAILAHGFDAYIAKPIEEKSFFKTINEVLYGA